MMKQLLLTAVACALVTSCSSTYMADIAPETRDCEIGLTPIGGFNASSVISYCKNPYTGCIETSGIQVHRDSGINNVAKLATSAAAIAGGTGSVLSGVGAIKYGNAWEDIAEHGLSQHFSGMSDTNIHVEGSSAHAKGAEANAGARAGARANANASASARASQKNHNNINVGIKNNNGGGGGHGGMKPRY